MLRAELGKFLRVFLKELKINGFEIFRPVAPIDPAMRSMMTSLKALLFLLARTNVNSMKVFTPFGRGIRRKKNEPTTSKFVGYYCFVKTCTGLKSRILSHL